MPSKEVDFEPSINFSFPFYRRFINIHVCRCLLRSRGMSKEYPLWKFRVDPATQWHCHGLGDSVLVALLFNLVQLTRMERF